MEGKKRVMKTEDLKAIWPDWELVGEPIGRGTFGAVYKAVRKDYNMESYAAIKIISIPLNASEVDSLQAEGLDMNATRTYLQEVVNDFVSEIQLMESLKGIQNIVSVEDYKVVEKEKEVGWNIYIRMELLTPFNEYMKGKKIEEEDVIKLGIDICTALEVCNKRNIIHRDIKPGNILINDFGDFKLGDFGIARKMENMTCGLTQNRGSYYYMAPEVAYSSEYDMRVDIYSLGIVLYRLLNKNRIPFLETEQQLMSPAKNSEVVERRMRGEKIPAPCDASPAMADVILRACAYSPDKRFSSATEMKNALKEVKNGTYQITGDYDSDNAKIDDSEKTIAEPKKSNNTPSKDANEVNTFNKKPKKKKRWKLFLLIVIILIGIKALLTIRDKRENDTEVRTRDTVSTNTIVNKTEGLLSKKDEEEISTLIEEAEKLAADGMYDDAIAKIKEGMKVYANSAELQEEREKLEKLLEEKTKQEIYAQAEEYAQAGNYISAIETVKKIKEEDQEYKDAYEAYVKSYEAEVLNDADNLANNGKYGEACQALKEAENIIGEDEELSNNTILSVKETAVARDYETAKATLAEATKVFPQNEKLVALRDTLNNSMPKDLINACPPYEEWGCDLNCTKSIAGQTYISGLTLSGGRANGEGAYALFNLEGKYESLEFDIGHIDESKMENVVIEISLDGMKAQVIELNAQDMLKHCVVPVNGAIQMKICQSSTGAEYGIVNAILYPDFEYSGEDCIAISNEETLTLVCPPYETRGYDEDKVIKMAGKSYVNGFV